MHNLEISLLGPFQVTLTGLPVTGFGYDKVRALFAYLVVESAQPHQREKLATLLWPDDPPDAARASLRKALSTLRKALRDKEASPSFLLAGRDSVQINPAGKYWLDIDVFDARLEAGTTRAHGQAEACETCIADLEEAARLYRGDFLQGLLIGDSAQFEEWVLIRREHFHARMLTALHHLTRHYLHRGEYAQAQKYALQQIKMEPYREEAHRALMHVLSRSGQRSAALAQYERCRRIMEEELGVAPSAETRSLYERIRSAGETRPHNLPPRYRPLVGREAELQEIGRHLANPDCRMLTLVGMGGIGKTRLALRAAQERLGDFLHGTYWVSLASLRHPAQILTGIIEALPLAPSSEPETQVLNYLRDKSILLILDNFEHLIPSERGGTDTAFRLLNKILQGAPHVKLLITSRERLNLRAEWLIQVEGLPYPADWTAETAEALPQYAAVQLFVQRARQMLAGFPSLPDAYPQIARICKLLQGVPLGIELASGWVERYTCRTIADEIEADLDFLVTPLRDIPDRHQSLRAVFEHSWRLLSGKEQAVLRRLSVFQTAFNRTAARQVTNAALPDLVALANKSFLHGEVGGRYSIHPLLNQFLAQKLAAIPSENQRTRRAHAAYYAHFLEEREYALTVQFQAAVLDEVGEEIADVRAAWDWAIAQKNTDIISRSLEGLFIYYWARNQFSEGQSALMQAADAIQTPDESPPNQLLLTRIRSRIAEFIFWLGNLTASEKLLLESIENLQHIDAKEELSSALALLSRVYRLQGEYGKSKETAAAAIEFAREAGQKLSQAQALCTLANTICDESGDFETAKLLYAESLSLYQVLDNPFGTAQVLTNQGAVFYEQGDFPRAQQLYRESLKHYRIIDYAYGVSVCLNNLAIIARKLGNLEEAKALIDESLMLKRETGNRVAIIHSLLEVGSLNVEMENFQAARGYLREALRMALDGQAAGLLHSIIVGFAEVYGKTGDVLQAAELAFWVLAQENVGQEAYSQAEKLRAASEPLISADELAQCKQRSGEKDIDSLITALLAE